MGKTKQYTFVQEVETALGYDEEHAEIILGKTITVKEDDLDIHANSLPISDPLDHESICTLLGITQSVLLKTLVNDTTMIDNIWNFIFDIDHFPCLCINMHIIKNKNNVKNTSRWGSKLKSIKSFYSGYHLLMTIPLNQKNNMVLLFLRKLLKNVSSKFQCDTVLSQIVRKETSGYPNFLNQEAKILINFREISDCPSAIDVLSDLKTFIKTRQPIYCLMSIPTSETKKQDHSQTILTILLIKKVLHTIKRRFPSEAEYAADEREMHSEDRINLGRYIINEVENLQIFLNDGRPPLNMNHFYFILHNYHDYYLKELYISLDAVPYHDLDPALKKADDMLLKTPFSVTEGCWILNKNEKNGTEIRNLTNKKFCIVFNEITVIYLEKLYSTFIDYRFVLSHADNAKSYQEPMLQTPDGGLYPIGINNYQKNPVELESVLSCILFLSACACNSTEEKTLWMCSKCKTFLQKIKDSNNWLKCICGAYKISDINKQCFKCLAHETTTVQQQINHEVTKEKDIPNINVVNESENDCEGSALNKLENEEMPPPNNKNIIFVGQTGAGKSTLINGFANYTKYNFDEACTEFLDCILPINFQMQDPKFQTVTIKAGPENAYENFNDGGQSVTQKAQTYKIIAGDETINIIDTPGLGDSRGAKQDLLNIESIKEAITKCGKIDAICFVIPSNISKLTANFEMNMRDLLSLFPKTAVKNVYFFFTYANSSFFAIGNTRKPLEEFIANFKATKNAEIQFGAENVFLVDSEAFMYFIATEQKYVYQNREQESFRMSWDKSKEAINKFFAKLKTVIPIKSSDIQMNYELENCIKNFSQNYPLPYELDNIQSLLVLAYSATSMSSLSFGTHKKFTNEELKESVKAAAEYCQKFKKEDDELKEKLQKLLQYYYSSFFQDSNVNNTISVMLPTNSNLILELKEICKYLKEYRNNEENNLSDDAKFVNANLDIFDAIDDENISPKLGFSLNFLLNYFKAKNNFEMEQKIDNILSLITAKIKKKVKN